MYWGTTTRRHLYSSIYIENIVNNDWFENLVMVINNGEVGLQNGMLGGGVQVKFYAYKKGDRKGFSHVEWGEQKYLR